MRKNNKIRSIHSSLKIEANSLLLDEVRDVINGRTVIGARKEIQEVKNAFEPLIYDILTSDCLSFPMENESDKENIKNILAQIGKIGLAFGKQMLTHKLKETTVIDINYSIKH